MTNNYQRIIFLLYLSLLSSVCFAQPASSDASPAEHPAKQRNLKGWWDDPGAATKLKLEAGQITKLAKLQEEFSNGQKTNSKKLKELHKQLGSAILAEDDKKIAETKKNIVKLVTSDAVKQVEFKISGLAVLNQQQLSGLASNYPEVLNKKWGTRSRGLSRSKGFNRAQRGARRSKARDSAKPGKNPQKTDKDK